MLLIGFNENYRNNKNKFFDGINDDKWNNWKWQLKNGIKRLDELEKFIPCIAKTGNDVKAHFNENNFFITPYFLCLIDFDKIKPIKGTLKINDPLARQVIPLNDEFSDVINTTYDPFSEYKTSPLKGCVRRFKDRLLILPTNICASYCRYCTRKWNWETQFLMKREDIGAIKKYLVSNPGIREIIISGGDPLLLPAAFLDELIFELMNLSSIETVRIATRLPSFLPQRINREITGILKKYKSLWIVTHFNHPGEITPLTAEALDNLACSGIALANQTVMLKGVNDDYEILKKLFYTLESLRVKPYYIFHCDPVYGTSHFNVSLQKGYKLMSRLRKDISGLSLPLYVVDLPGKGKIPVTAEMAGNP